jgi:DNA-binding transcriptional LysR family regulator
MDIRDLDLNLLVIFDAMARTRSVSKAADAVGLSQPATSAALARLRETLGDHLFVRVGSQMQPTPRAQQLAPVVRRVVDAVNHEVLQVAAFDPSAARRRFTILTPDIGEVAFLPGVLKRLRAEAPHITLCAVAKPKAEAAQALEGGEADLAVGYFPDLEKAGFYQQRLFKTSYTCIACEGYTGLPAKPTWRQYLGARHVVVLPDGREHLLDRYLAGKGHHREVALELSHFMSLLALLPGSDLVATVPDDIATVVGRLMPLRTVELPFKPPQLLVQQYWHRRLHDDPANRWLRQVFHEVNRRDGLARLPGLG